MKKIKPGQEETLHTVINVKHVWIWSFALSIAALLGFLRHGLKLEASEKNGIWAWIEKSNLVFYFTALFVFFAAFLAFRWILSNCFKVQLTLHREFPQLLSKIVTGVIVAGVLAPMLNWLVVQQYFESNSAAKNMPISKVPAGYAIVLVTSGVMLIMWAMQKEKDFLPNWLTYVYVLCVALTFWALYFPNIFAADLHHGIAVLESIFNVADLTPFTYATTGIYGQYGLFFLLPLRLFGCDIETVVAMMALFGCIACVAVLYVIHCLLPKNWMRMMAAFASIFHVVVMRNSNIWQAQPIRVLFPAIFIAYALYLSKHNEKSQRWKIGFGWLLGILAVLWNRETGVSCLLAFVAFSITEYWQTNKWYEKKMWFVYGYSIIFCVSAVLGSITIVNLYNLLCGGPLVFRTFFFPLQVQEYMIDALKWDLVWGNRAWVYVLILFLLILCWGLYHTSWFWTRKENSWSMAPAAVLIAVLGLLNFSYYANRAAWHNLDICMPMAICGNALIIGELWPQVYKNPQPGFSLDVCCKKAAVFVCMTVVFCLSIQLFYTPTRMKERYEGGSQYTINLRREAETLRKEIPENTYGIGSGISIIYHILGWDNYGHFRDESDLLVGGTVALDEMVESVLRQDSFLCSLAQKRTILNRVLKADDRYQYEKSITIQGKEYQYYVKRP